MQSFPFTVRASIFCFSVGLLVACPSVRADTVYLKNGAYIDGLVTARNETLLTITIGEIGKLEVSMDDVIRVEKNSRTGSRTYVPVDRRELPAVVKKKNESSGDPEEPGAADEENESEASDESSEASSEDGSSDSSEGDRDEGDEDEIDAELKAEIENLVADLQRQKTKYRRRAERKLQKIGAPAVPFLLPLATRGGDLTRITALRLVSEHATERDPEIVEVCLKALRDENYFVRDYAVKTLRKLTKEDFDFDPKAGTRSRGRAVLKWQKWWDQEKEALEAQAQDEDDEEVEEDEVEDEEEEVQADVDHKKKAAEEEED